MVELVYVLRAGGVQLEVRTTEMLLRTLIAYLGTVVHNGMDIA
jgi:hypothetical protein